MELIFFSLTHFFVDSLPADDSNRSNTSFPITLFPIISLIRRSSALVLAVFFCALAQSPAKAAQPGDALQARYISLQAQLKENAFHRPLYLESRESEEELRGDIYVVADHPYEVVRQSLQGSENWCDILILHLNVKNCRAIVEPAGQSLVVSIGKKHDAPLEKAFPVEFSYRVPVNNENYLRIRLHADTGPLGTKNYQIVCEVVPLEAGRSFIHLSYSYDYGLTARLAMKGYLTTLGSGKVGFSAADSKTEGAPGLIGGVRGVVERNTMRYYLAIDAYLDSLSAPPAEQLELRLRNWFAATETFHRQLHEISETDYLMMKHNEVRRQKRGPQTKDEKEIVNSGG